MPPAGRPKVDIEARTYRFALDIVRLCQALDARPGVPRTLGNQLLRSGTSVGANVEEAQAAHSRPDFIAKMTIALKGARETRYWLRLLVDAGAVPRDNVSPLVAEGTEVMNILGAIIAACRRNDRGGDR